MKKKLLTIMLALASALALTSCSGSDNVLYVLNWGDYFATDELKAKFEEENNCVLKMVTDVSNENFYNTLVSGKTAIDLIIPSDYMVDKMKDEDLIEKIDYSKLSNYEEGMFASGLEKLMNDPLNANFKDYYIPYFWGSLGIMYSTKTEGVEEAVLENGYKVFFEQNLLPAGTKVGMYDSSRDSFAAAELYLGYSLNTKDDTELKACKDLLAKTHFNMWGTDDLKKSVVAGNLDVSLVYSGDFFDCLYSSMENGEDIDYNIYAPMDANNVFFDAMVIPKSCHNRDLAYKFIDFMLDYENSYTNTDYIGYSPTLKAVAEDILADEEWSDITCYDAYNPTLIVDQAKEKAEVYRNLGDQTYLLVENYFAEIRSSKN